jgi:hypothetical protein
MTAEARRRHFDPSAVRRSGLMLGATVALALSLLGCAASTGGSAGTPTEGASSPGAGTSAPAASATTAATEAPASQEPAASASAGSETGERGATMTLSGLFDKTYTTQDAAAVSIGDSVIIAIHEPGSGSCSLSLRVVTGIAPGTYKVENKLKGSDDLKVSALYTTLTSCNDAGAEGDYQSIDGSLTLTETGTVWSGTIEANMATRQATKVILTVKGSFTGLTMR